MGLDGRGESLALRRGRREACEAEGGAAQEDSW